MKVNKIIIILFFSTISILFLLHTISLYNIYKITPTNSEIKLITRIIGNIKIIDEADIIRINNTIVDSIESVENLHFPIDIRYNIYSKKGLCYDRSLILQKIFIRNKIPLRPIYLYYYNDGSKVSFVDLFSTKLNSHNIFEFKINDKWYIMRTNTKMKKLQSLDEYLLDNDEIIPPNANYIKYLNNRNSKFIYPSWIPDIYYFY